LLKKNLQLKEKIQSPIKQSACTPRLFYHHSLKKIVSLKNHITEKSQKKSRQNKRGFFLFGAGANKKIPSQPLCTVAVGAGATATERRKKKSIKKRELNRKKHHQTPPHQTHHKKPAPTPPITAGIGQEKGVDNFFGEKEKER